MFLRQGEKKGIEKAGERNPADFREIFTVLPSGLATLFFSQVIIEYIRNEIKHGFREKFSGSV